MYTVGSLFTGVGMFDPGFAWAGFRVRWQVEFDAWCQELLRARGNIFDHPTIYGDVRSVGAGRQHEPGYADVLIGGFPCFVEGTMILTKRGYVPIETVTTDDLVLTHNLRWRPVTNVMQRDNANIHEIKAQGTTPILTTSEHPFYARLSGSRWNNDRRSGERCFSEPAWVNASDVSDKHFLSQGLPPETNEDEHSEAFWWVVGRYLADGWRVARKNRPVGSGRVVICAGYKKADTTRASLRAAGFNPTEVKERAVVKFHITNNALYQFLEAFGALAHGKTLPGFVYELTTEKARALLTGYLSGDGYRDERAKAYSATTVSKALALSVALLAQRAFGVIATIRHHETKPKTSIEGRTVNQRSSWYVIIPDRNKSGVIIGDYGWKKVKRSVDTGTTATVYNISVAEDESYFADGSIVHNCQPFSIAGLRKGADDNRNMWPDFRRVISDIRPRAVVLENSPAICDPTTADDGSQQPAYAITITANLAEMGYDTTWGIIRAFDTGAFHPRARWWLVAYADSPRLEGAHGGQPAQLRFAGRGRRLHQPRLVGNPHGTAYRLDEPRYPAGMGSEQHAYEPPRTAAKVPHQRERTKALGNGLSPQIAYALAVGVRAELERRDREQTR